MPFTVEIQKMGSQTAHTKMSAEQRKDRARNAALARWKKKKGIDWHPPLPEVAYRGSGFLGNPDIECYVLTNGERVISSSQAQRLLTGKGEASLVGAGILKISGLKSLISSNDLADQTVQFYIAGNPTIASGITAEFFSEICHAFVSAACSGHLTSQYQRSIAMRCAVYQKAFMKLGIVAYIDELTGFQSIRSKTALDEKIQAYVLEEARKWEKTFPDLFYQELARLCGLQDWKKKPSFYGKITNKIYRMVDPDVAEKIKEMADELGTCRHQHLSENLGLSKLRDSINQTIGLARSCISIQEFNQKMKLFEPGGTYQMAFPFDKSLIKSFN